MDNNTPLIRELNLSRLAVSQKIQRLKETALQMDDDVDPYVWEDGYGNLVLVELTLKLAEIDVRLVQLRNIALTGQP